MASIPVTLLSAVTASGAGASKSIGDFNIDSDRKGVPNGWTVEVKSTAASTAIVIDLEGSIDGGTTFFQLARHTFTAGELTAKQAMFHVINKGELAVRANLITFTRSGTETLTAKAIASSNG